MGFWDFLYRSDLVKGMAKDNTTFPIPQKRTDLPDYSEEFASELQADVKDRQPEDSYSENGISLEDTSSVFKLTYNGILAKDGAADVYAVIGSGDNERWESVKTYPMRQTAPQTFELLFPSGDESTINIAFKDGADHWDNNSGKNYVYTMGQGG